MIYGSELVLSVCAFVLCFSSLFLSVLLCVESDPEMNWSENENVNSFPGQRGKFWSIGMQFPENCIFCCNQTCGKGWKWFPEIIFTQNKCSLSLIFKQKNITTYLTKTENFLLKVLQIKVKTNWNNTVGLVNSTKKYSGTHE